MQHATEKKMKEQALGGVKILQNRLLYSATRITI